MKLVVPTDFEILDAMSNAQRQTAPNLAEILDQKRQYMNDRLSNLSSMGLVRKVGPSERSGMYEITSKGLTALEFQEHYEHEKASEFAKLIDEYQSKQEEKSEIYQELDIEALQMDNLFELYIEHHNKNRYDLKILEKILEELESRDLIKKKECNGENYYTIT